MIKTCWIIPTLPAVAIFAAKINENKQDQSRERIAASRKKWGRYSKRFHNMKLFGKHSGGQGLVSIEH